MCKCNPVVKTPFCGKPGCQWPGGWAANKTFTPALVAARDAAPNAGLGGMPGFQRPPAILPVLEASGLTESAARALLADVQANHRLLTACLGHQFVPLDVPGSRITARYRCSVCTGTVDSHAKHWYDLGRGHGAAHGARPLPPLTNDERLDGLES